MIESVNQTQSAVEFSVSGMHCQGCVRSVESALASVEGVESVKVSLFPPKAVLVLKGDVSLETLNRALKSVGDYALSEWNDEIDAPLQFALPIAQQKPTPFWLDAPKWKRASFNTLNCLIGCSIGDFGFIIYAQSVGLQWSMWAIMGVAIVCGLTTSVMLETVILKVREGFSWKLAVQTAFSMSFLSMLAMEISENATDYFLTGGTVMPHEPFYWLALALALIAGFIVPLPYNYWKLKKFNKACH
jgi:copper chaperone CopZ